MHRPPLALALFPALLLAASTSPAFAANGAIQDNSFLVEEAYNQEPGVIQHISAFNRSPRTGEWAYSFTEEWPVLGQTHQASITINAAGLRSPSRSGLGDVALNYRWQAVGDGNATLALSPRVTLLLPGSTSTPGLGSGGPGLQLNVPMSATLFERIVTHTNVGGTYVPSAPAAGGAYGRMATFSLGQSVIWLAHQNLNFLAEVVYSSTEPPGSAGTGRVTSLTVNPGLRAAVNFPNGLQMVPGVSVPIGVGPSRGERAVFFYLSFEHAFRLAGPTDESLAPNR